MIHAQQTLDSQPCEWFVEFETRTPGSIGEFTRRSEVVTAPSLAPDQAVLRAQRAFNAAGYETRFPITVRHAAARQL